MRKAFFVLLTLAVLLLTLAAGPAAAQENKGSGAGIPYALPPVAAKAADSQADSIASDTVPVDSVPADSVPPDTTVITPRRPAREITPVDIDDQKPTVVLHYYDKHGDPLEEPVLFLATLDTITKPKSRPVYPLFSGLDFGVNFADAILMAAGQSYGSFDIWADVSLHNWFFPVVEAGIGFADSSPKNSNFTYKTKPSFYAKIGINYNFLYKSNPDYTVFFGLRAGFSSFRFDVDNVTVDNGYWGDTQHLNLRGLGATSFYGEALAGIKVKIYRNFSLGWSIRYHFNFKTTAATASKPWFIPGYGASSPISLSFSAIWTLPSPGRREAERRLAEEKAAAKK